MMVGFLLNCPRDIPLAIDLEATCPVDDFVVGITLFHHRDEYGWRKPKELNPCFDKADLVRCTHRLRSAQILTDRNAYERMVRDCDVVLSRGREYIICRPTPTRTQYYALSGNRSYFGRLLDALPHYAGRLRLCLFGAAWLRCGSYEMHGNTDAAIARHERSIAFANWHTPAVARAKRTPRTVLRQRLGLPADKRVVFFPCRMAAPSISMYSSGDEWYDVLTATLAEVRRAGYYVLADRRMGIHDQAYGAAYHAPQYVRWSALRGMVDAVLGQPDMLWEALAASDCVLAGDVSGLLYIEAALLQVPVCMPKIAAVLPHGLCPAMRDMITAGAVHREIAFTVPAGLPAFLDRWYTSKGIDGLWREVLR